MATVETIAETDLISVGDLLALLGDISPNRIPLGPAIGEATEEDLLRFLDHSDRLYELVDGVLVEKVMGFAESVLAAHIIYVIKLYLASNDLGIVTAPDGPFRILARKVRMPDVAFISWQRLPIRKVTSMRICDAVPDLAMEVLSESNTAREMDRKLSEYFTAGVRLVWYIDPVTRTARAYQAINRVET